MSEIRRIVVLGASFGGLSAAHYICKHILPKLKQSKDVKYDLLIVDSSTHFWWHIAAPRSIVSVKEMKLSDSFVPIMDGFKQYTNLKDSITFRQATATSLDAASRTIYVKTHEGVDETLHYYALIIATGIRSPTPLTTFHGDHTISQKALEDMNEKLATAKEVVVGGGGPVGVETAGELGSHLGSKAKITLVTGSDKLLPVLRKSLSDKAQKQLQKVGVKVKYGAKIQSTDQLPDGKTKINLDNGESLTADVYIPASGIVPNTAFLPAELRQSSGYVKTNPQTLRVDEAGDRVYAVGDVAGVDKGGILNLFKTIPVAGANIAHDLLKDAKAGSVSEKQYTRKDNESQLVPVGAKTGVGAFNGWKMPGFAISKIKGKDYMLSNMPGITEGKQWTKA